METTTRQRPIRNRRSKKKNNAHQPRRNVQTQF